MGLSEGGCSFSETMEEIVAKSGGCDDVKGIECRSVTQTSDGSVRQQVVCNILDGFVCRGEDQPPGW
ncbi:hypothetical protein CEXT_692631 [Caerostris extrusa]|uniref:WxxW domain-containing protein n=1 Tax=Caerostris extrusa TaxID=172846 RepID=A0AAV4V8D0_CAEEX|nr:hypothetical protein CEXT_692631 [Caerostris extrusa]